MAKSLRSRQIFNVGVNPSHLAVTPDSRRAYVTNSNSYGIAGSDTVTVLDLRKGTTKLTIRDESFVQPYRVAIDDLGEYAYVCNSGSPAESGQEGTLSVIDIKSNKVVGTIPGFDGPGAIVLSQRRGKGFAYVTNYGAPAGVKSDSAIFCAVGLSTKNQLR